MSRLISVKESKYENDIQFFNIKKVREYSGKKTSDLTNLNLIRFIFLHHRIETDTHLNYTQTLIKVNLDPAPNFFKKSIKKQFSKKIENSKIGEPTIIVINNF